jgi:type IV secretion system protein VirB1
MIAAALLACALHVAPATLEAVIRVESRGNPLALHVNHLDGPQPVASSPAEAAAIARHYIGLGFSVDLGLMQINSRNLLALGDTIEDAFDPCRNITGGAAILTADYARAVEQSGEGQPALLAALSAYNTGDFARGFANGYVGRVTGIPALGLASTTAAPPAPPDPLTAATIVYSGKDDVHVTID